MTPIRILSYLDAEVNRRFEVRLHHVQVSMPEGEEEMARLFYRDAVGLQEVDKPASLAGRGGCWFRYSEGTVVVAEIHLGVEEQFVPAKKAHPALCVPSARELEDLAGRITAAGFGVDWSERYTFEGYVRFHTADGFGNRVEVLAPAQ